MTFDLLIRAARIVGPRGVVEADLGVSGETIAAMGLNLVGSARKEIDARGLHLFPGFLDAHVHFNEPGRETWEGIETGSRALAAGGGTVFFDMPLNSDPPVLDAATFAAKEARTRALSRADFALWGGLTPTNLDRLDELADCGVVGFKAFMSASGIAESPRADRDALRRGMRTAAARGLPVAVHAEDEEMTSRLARERIAAGRTGIDDYLASRPVEAEVAAVRDALALAGETGCTLHVVHVSSPEALAEIVAAKRGGLAVTAETCPHYLLLDEDDLRERGAVAKCAPPLRSATRRALLWERFLAGDVDTLGSDHSPAPPEMKGSADFFSVWGGISGCQHGTPLVLAEAFHAVGEAALPRLASQAAEVVARVFDIPNKGVLRPGNDADFTLVDFRAREIVASEGLLYRHRQSPYLGLPCAAAVRCTWRRGERIFPEPPATRGGGRLLRPAQSIGRPSPRSYGESGML
jgi:allantoinase